MRRLLLITSLRSVVGDHIPSSSALCQLTQGAGCAGVTAPRLQLLLALFAVLSQRRSGTEKADQMDVDGESDLLRCLAAPLDVNRRPPRQRPCGNGLRAADAVVQDPRTIAVRPPPRRCDCCPANDRGATRARRFDGQAGRS